MSEVKRELLLIADRINKAINFGLELAKEKGVS